MLAKLGGYNKVLIRLAVLLLTVAAIVVVNLLSRFQYLKLPQLQAATPCGVIEFNDAKKTWQCDGDCGAGKSCRKGDSYKECFCKRDTATPTATPTSTPAPVFIPGDLNQDLAVNIFDYNLLIADFGKTGTPGFIQADIDKNGEVDIFDYNVLLANFGKSNITPSPTLTPTSTPTPSPNPQVFNLKVLGVALNPTEGSRDLATTYYGWLWPGKTPEEVENEIFNQIASAMKELSAGTINYQVTQKIRLTTFPKYTDGFQFTIDNYQNCIQGTRLPNGRTCHEEKYYFDHIDFIRANRICEIANETEIDEIWWVTNPYIGTWENWMIGPSPGFNVNGKDYIIPKCNRHYIIQSVVYPRRDSIMEVYGHRVEATMNYITGRWDPQERVKHWLNFSNIIRYGLPPGEFNEPGCGNAHFPLNAVRGYDYINKTIRDFNCPDWKNFPDYKGETESINCDAWGCFNEGWAKHWLGSMPRSEGEALIKSKDGNMVNFKKNWWYYFLYPENVISFMNQF